MAQIVLRDDPDELIQKPANRGMLALRFHIFQMKIGAAFEAYLEKVIFKVPVRGSAEKDRKLRQKYQRALRTRDAYQILVLIWKESQFFTDEMLAQAKIFRVFAHRPLTVYGLARDLAEHKADRSKMNSRIRTIALAARPIISLSLMRSTRQKKFSGVQSL